MAREIVMAPASPEELALALADLGSPDLLVVTQPEAADAVPIDLLHRERIAVAFLAGLEAIANAAVHVLRLDKGGSREALHHIIEVHRKCPWRTSYKRPMSSSTMMTTTTRPSTPLGA